MALNSEFKATMLELAADSSIQMFDTIIESIENFNGTQRPIKTLMRVFEGL